MPYMEAKHIHFLADTRHLVHCYFIRERIEFPLSPRFHAKQCKRRYLLEGRKCRGIQFNDFLARWYWIYRHCNRVPGKDQEKIITR